MDSLGKRGSVWDEVGRPEGSQKDPEHEVPKMSVYWKRKEVGRRTLLKEGVWTNWVREEQKSDNESTVKRRSLEGL